MTRHFWQRFARDGHALTRCGVVVKRAEATSDCARVTCQRDGCRKDADAALALRERLNPGWKKRKRKPRIVKRNACACGNLKRLEATKCQRCALHETKLSDDQTRGVIRRYTAGVMTVMEIAAEFNVSDRTIHRVIKRFNVKGRGQ